MAGAEPAAAAGKLDELTSLRFFAAAAIVLLHLQGAVVPMANDSELALGVSFFFVLSGYILTHVYRRLENTTPAAFCWNRFARLWPLHVVTTLLAIALIFPLGHLAQVEWQLVGLANLLMVQAWIPLSGVTRSFNSPSWSISTEVFFYLAFPWLARTRHLLGAYLAVAALTVGILVVLDLTVSWSGEQTARWTFSPGNLILHSPLMRLLEFATGVAAARMVQAGGLAWLRHCSARFPTGIEVAAVAAVLAFAYGSTGVSCLLEVTCRPVWRLWTAQSAGMYLFALMIVVFALGAGRLSALLRHRWLVVLGEVSFATYLWHQIVIKYFVKQGWVAALGWPWAAFLVLVVVYAGSYALWRWVECPARRALLAHRPV